MLKIVPDEQQNNNRETESLPNTFSLHFIFKVENFYAVKAHDFSLFLLQRDQNHFSNLS